MRHHSHRQASAFIKAELLALLVLGVLVVAVLAVAGDHARRSSRSAGSIANLQKFASGVTSFAADNEDRIVTFSWRAANGRTDRTGYVFPNSANDIEAAADQAVAIMRWYASRTDITAIRGWAPHFAYNHLALIEHLEHPLPADFVVSPHDLNRLAWQRSVRNQSPGEAGQGFFSLTNRPEGTSNTEKRWPFSSSYEFVPASFSPDARQLTPNGLIPTFAQGTGSHSQYTIGIAATPVGRRRVSEVVYPDRKVLVFETSPAGDAGAVGTFYALSQKKSPALFADGSVQARALGSANAGFQPNNPFMSSPTRINYGPNTAWEAPTTSGTAQQLVNGGVRWTRSGLRGRDFDGPEVPWID